MRASRADTVADVDWPNDERPLIASVFMNRIKMKGLLQCDPTVIYALEQVNRYRGTIFTADLQFDSPYNTSGPWSTAQGGGKSWTDNPAVAEAALVVRLLDGHVRVRSAVVDEQQVPAWPVDN